MYTMKEKIFRGTTEASSLPTYCLTYFLPTVLCAVLLQVELKGLLLFFVLLYHLPSGCWVGFITGGFSGFFTGSCD